MENIKNTMDNYTCNICNKQYSSYKSLWNHNKEFHKINNNKLHSSGSKVVHSNLVSSPISNPQSNLTTNELEKKEILYSCRYCIKQYSNRQNRWKHEQKCKNIKQNNLELDKIKKETKQKQIELLLKKEETKILKEEILQKKISINNQLINSIVDKTNTILKETINELKKQPSINNQLINLIVDKTNTIQELKTKIDENKTDNNSLTEINNNIQLKEQTLKLNDVVVISRSEDNYINATQLCQAGGKQFNEWFRLNTTKLLLIEAVSETGLTVSQLIDLKKGNSNEFQKG